MVIRKARWFSCAVAFLAAIPLCGVDALATDYYVDAANGNDANAGTSSAAAWRTITHAIAQLPQPATGLVDVIHVAPGVYDPALGEVFPLFLTNHDAVQLVGDGGSEVTILDGGGAGALIRDWPEPFSGSHTGPLTLVQGLTLRHGGNGIELGSVRLKATYLTIRDVRITGMSGRAVWADTSDTFASGIEVNATFERTQIHGCQQGIYVQSRGAGSYGHTTLTFDGCSITRNRTTGIWIQDPFQSVGSHVVVRRTRIVGNGEDGVRVEQGYTNSVVTTSARMTACVIARNRGAGVKVVLPSASTGGNVVTSLERCTVADNLLAGVDTFVPPSIPPSYGVVTTITGSIVHGNGDDVNDNPLAPTLITPTYCDIGDGDFVGVNGNVAVDPLFRARVDADYRLVWGSPCVDVGDPATPAGEMDAAGVARPVDGDLDAVEVADMGAHEFAPLWIAGAPHVGGTLVVEQWGPIGGTTSLFAVRGLPLPTPQATPFGEFDLDPSLARGLGARPVGSIAPTTRVLHLPADPLFAGQAITLQALNTSSVVSPPFAYTNAVTVTILP